MKIEPSWIADLVRMCAADDWSDLDNTLGHPRVSPMFKRLLPDLAEAEDVTGYSSAEMRACREGLEWLSRTHPELYVALAWQFQRWRRKHLDRTDNHDALVQQAASLLAGYVDKVLGD